MKQETSIGLRIFLQFWALLAVLAVFNIYSHVKAPGKLSLALAIVCVVAFAGWGLAYALYFGKSSGRGDSAESDAGRKGSDRSDRDDK